MDKPVVLIPVVGTERGSIMKAKQFHLDCIDLVVHEKIRSDEDGVEEYSYLGMKFEEKEKKMSEKNGQLRVWWVPQVPGKPYYKTVDSLKEARLLLDVLGEYDDFQFKNNITPDYSNAGGLEIYENDEWVDWVSEDGDDFDTYCEDSVAF